MRESTKMRIAHGQGVETISEYKKWTDENKKREYGEWQKRVMIVLWGGSVACWIGMIAMAVISMNR